MTAFRRILLFVVGIEVLGAALLVGRRLNSTRIAPPLVAQYNDSPTGVELLALPDQFLFDGPAKWRALGEAYLTFGYFPKADACLRRAVAAAPSDTEVALAHGFVLERLGQIEEATEVFERAAHTSRGLLAQMAWHHVGRNFLRREQAEQALAAFEQAGDDHDPSLYQRAKWLIRAGRAGESLPLLDSLAANYPNDLHVWYLKGMAAAQLGNGEAVAEARDARDVASRELEVDDLEALFKPFRERFGLARSISAAARQQRVGDPARAAEIMEATVRDDPRWENGSLFLLQDVAEIQGKANRPELAEELALRQIRTMGFPTAVVWEVLADVARNRGDSEAAREALAHAERMLPTASHYFKLAELAKSAGDYGDYHRDLSRSKLLDARQLMQSRQLEDAQTRLREALELDPESADAWYLLGETRRRLKQFPSARTAFRRCLELDPDHGRAQERLNRLPERPTGTERPTGAT